MTTVNFTECRTLQLSTAYWGCKCTLTHRGKVLNHSIRIRLQHMPSHNILNMLKPHAIDGIWKAENTTSLWSPIPVVQTKLCGGKKIEMKWYFQFFNSIKFYSGTFPALPPVRHTPRNGNWKMKCINLLTFYHKTWNEENALPKLKWIYWYVGRMGDMQMEIGK